MFARLERELIICLVPRAIQEKKKKASESLAIIHCHIHFSLNSEDEKIEHLGRELSLSWSLDEHNVGMELFFSVFNIINCFFKTGRFAPGIKKCR